MENVQQLEPGQVCFAVDTGQHIFKDNEVIFFERMGSEENDLNNMFWFSNGNDSNLLERHEFLTREERKNLDNE